MTSKISKNLEKRKTITVLIPGGFREAECANANEHTEIAVAQKDLAMVVLQRLGQSGSPPLANPEELLASLPAGEDGAAESAHLLGKSFPCLT